MSALRNEKRFPKVAVIIAAYNYDQYIEGAIRSVLEQSHADFELVIVDDQSAPESFAATQAIVDGLKDERIRLIRNETNVGQTHSFYAGISATDAAFVCLLDPDDRYHPKFLERMLIAHLNPIHIAPLAFCNQQYVIGQERVTSTQSSLLRSCFVQNRMDELKDSLRKFGFSRFVPANTTRGGWIWTSTSSMMFRRDALELIRPIKSLHYRAFADTYVANGTHILGGTLFVHKVLTSRTLHRHNAFSHGLVFASDQCSGIPDYKGGNPKLDAVEALFESGNSRFLRKPRLRAALFARLKPSEMLTVWRNSSAFRTQMGTFILLQSLLRKMFAR